MVAGRYHTFWPRFWAGWIDVFVLGIPMLYFDKWFYRQEFSAELTFLYYISVSLSFCVYSVLMHGILGQTIGKIAMNVEVVSMSGEKLGLKRAVLRDSVLILTTIIWLILEAPQISQGVSPLEPGVEEVPYNFLDYAELVWFFAEVLTMLTNSKRRAIHDYIAGSVVQRC